VSIRAGRRPRLRCIRSGCANAAAIRASMDLRTGQRAARSVGPRPGPCSDGRERTEPAAIESASATGTSRVHGPELLEEAALAPADHDIPARACGIPRPAKCAASSGARNRRTGSCASGSSSSSNPVSSCSAACRPSLNRFFQVGQVFASRANQLRRALRCALDRGGQRPRVHVAAARSPHRQSLPGPGARRAASCIALATRPRAGSRRSSMALRRRGRSSRASPAPSTCCRARRSASATGTT
jgi:hypothetical protein